MIRSVALWKCYSPQFPCLGFCSNAFRAHLVRSPSERFSLLIRDYSLEVGCEQRSYQCHVLNEPENTYSYSWTSGQSVQIIQKLRTIWGRFELRGIKNENTQDAIQPAFPLGGVSLRTHEKPRSFENSSFLEICGSKVTVFGGCSPNYH